jgi:aryl-alcohol dehydrogenase-like predicted oxidoreductase
MTQTSKIALGTAQLATAYGVTNERLSDPSDDEGLNLLRKAAAAGVGVVDTAPVYGRAELLLGRCTDRFRVHTKVRPGVSVSESLRASRRALAGQPIEVLYLHDPEAVLDPDGPLLTEARAVTAEEGVLLGASIYDEAQFEAALNDPDIAVVQVPGNVLDRRFTGEALTRAASHSTRVVVRSVLLQGVLATSPALLPPPVAHLSPWVAAFADAARDNGLDPVAAAVAWVLRLSGVSAAVLGATSPQDLDGILLGVTTELSAGARHDIGAIPLPDAEMCDPRQWAA